MSVAIYTRQSLDRTGLEAGVGRQLTECQSEAEARGLTVNHELSDNDVSATSGVVRPAFEKLLALISSGEVATVIVWHPDRLYRRLADLVRITDIAKDTGLMILSVQASDIDLSTASGRMVASMVGAAAAHEGELRTARQKLSYSARAEAGEWHFSRRPFGYRREGAAVVIVPEEAEVLRSVLRRYYDDGASRHSIMSGLNSAGVLTPQGKAWGIIQVRDLLRNNRYAGISSYNGVIVGSGNWEPMVDEQTWVRWQSTMAQRRRKSTFTSAAYLLSGIAKCGLCGAPCYPKMRAKGNGVSSYRCSAKSCVSRAVHSLDSYINQLMVARIRQPDALGASQPVAAPVEDLYAEAVEIQMRIDDLGALLADGTLSARGVRDAAAPLHAKLAVVEGRIDERAAGALRLIPTKGVDAEKHWNDTLTLIERRQLIRATVTIAILPIGNGNRRVFDPSGVDVRWIR